jgi:hypothetical protein
LRSIDVVEPAGDQGDLEDATIVKSHGAKAVVEFWSDAGRIERDLFGVLEHDALLIRDCGGTKGVGQRFDERPVQRHPTQKLCVRLQSILAPIDR